MSAKTPPCERCHSKNTYQDHNGVVPVVACLMCGHRSGEQIIVSVSDGEKLDRHECDNCGRAMVLRQGLCGTCGRAAHGLKGEDREEALDMIKARIEFDDIRWGGHIRAGKTKLIDHEKEEPKMPTKKPCSNCGRELGLVGNLCSTCRKAAKGKLAGEQRDQALAVIKIRIANGEIRARGGKKAEVEHPAASLGTLLVSERAGREIPITLRLTIEIGIRIMGITQAEAYGTASKGQVQG